MTAHPFDALPFPRVAADGRLSRQAMACGRLVHSMTRILTPASVAAHAGGDHSFRQALGVYDMIRSRGITVLNCGLWYEIKTISHVLITWS